MALDLGMPILVVDDYQTMVRIIRNLLKQMSRGAGRLLCSQLVVPGP
jgi:CheY-like chemotaxis protein